MVLYTTAKVHSLVGQWEEAMEYADRVLKAEVSHITALLIKSEALYNTCHFEHALLHFHKVSVSILSLNAS